MQESLRLTQEQKLVQRLSPMQVRYVRMLEMNSLEMDEAVRRELDDNQALAIDDSVTERQQTEDGRDFTESSEELQRKDYADDDDIPYYRLNTNNYSSDSSGYDYIQPDNSETLYDNLCRQIDERDISEDVAQTAKYIIGNLDSNGWLQRDLMLIIDDLAFQHGIEVPEDIARQALKEVRSLEPVGIGAKDLRDCLMLQLNALPATPNNYIARLIIADHFDEFSLKHFDRIRSLLKLDADTFQKALDTVLNLNPKPGASIGNSQTDNRSQQIIADFIIDIDDDDIRITLNNNI
ncbi:MAG: RNA polymerase sigma-54 factor, partial [Muribaculaceae bacterium]|nr:RNA polymerase sigma-54 factor [Muribaculaceae bacterium]